MKVCIQFLKRSKACPLLRGFSESVSLILKTRGRDAELRVSDSVKLPGVCYGANCNAL